MKRLYALALLALATPAAWADVGPPSSGGQIVAEPIGLLDVAVTRESLTIDLTPLADAKLAHIQAVYKLDNAGLERILDLVFPGGESFVVRLDDRDVPAKPNPNALPPPSWEPPATTPGLDGRDLAYLQTGRRKVTPQSFQLTIPPGPHTLTVRYDAEAARHRADGRMSAWQFAYVFAPARAWSEFGGLDVEVRLPTGWRIAGTPDLLRGGDVLSRSFDAVPADALAVTVQVQPSTSYQPLVYGRWIALGLAGFVGAVACVQSGWWCGRRRRPAWRRVSVLALLWGIALAASGTFVIFGPDLAIPEAQRNPASTEETVGLLLALGLGVAAVPVGCVIGLVFAALGRRRPELYMD